MFEDGIFVRGSLERSVFPILQSQLFQDGLAERVSEFLMARDSG